MELWIIVVAGLALLALLYMFYRVLLAIQDALHDIQAAIRSISGYSYSTASQTTQTNANIKYFVEFYEARVDYHDELRRQQLLREVRREHLAQQVTPIAPITPPPTTEWIGDQSMQAMQRNLRQR